MTEAPHIRALLPGQDDAAVWDLFQRAGFALELIFEPAPDDPEQHRRFRMARPVLAEYP